MMHFQHTRYMVAPASLSLHSVFRPFLWPIVFTLSAQLPNTLEYVYYPLLEPPVVTAHLMSPRKATQCLSTILCTCLVCAAPSLCQVFYSIEPPWQK